MRLSSPLKVATTLFSGFRSRTVRYGRGAVQRAPDRGRQTPLPGIPVRVIERFDPGAIPRERVSTVWTGANGAFSIHLARAPAAI